MKDTLPLRCVRNGTKLLYGFTIQSLSTSGHKGSFTGIMFVLHSCCVSAAFTTTSETVYWYNASIPAWLMPSAQIRISRIYVVDSIFTKLPLFIAYIFTPRCFGSDNIRNGIGRGEKSRSVSLHPVFEKT